MSPTIAYFAPYFMKRYILIAFHFIADKKALLLYRSVRTWWTLLALSNAEGYREHVAMVWELSALVVCFVIYMTAVLAIFLTLDVKGRDPSIF